MNFQQFQAHNQGKKLKSVENIKEGKESKEWIERKNACDLLSRTHGLFSGCSLASLLHFLEVGIGYFAVLIVSAMICIVGTLISVCSLLLVCSCILRVHVG